jgi:F-type H+-transporting ATPase subunit b
MEIHLDQILFQIVNFSVVMGALSYLLYKPVLKIFEERALRIAEGQKAATKAIEQQQAAEALKTEARKELKKERAEVLETATKEAEVQKKQLVAEARELAQSVVTESKARWEEEKAQELQKMHADLVSAVIATTEKVLESKLTKTDHAALIDKELTNILKSL